VISVPKLWVPRAIGHSDWYRHLVAKLAGTADLAVWRVHAHVDKFLGDVDEFRAKYGREEGEIRFPREAKLVGVANSHFNVLTTAGATALWNALTQGSAGAFTNSTAALGVGDSSTAETAAQTNLQAATNAYRQVMDATFPTVSTNTATFKVTVGTGNANFQWLEWGLFSAVGTGSPPTGGTMLNRKVPAGGLGTKTSSASWAFTATISLS
jgi:hypothetical protein